MPHRPSLPHIAITCYDKDGNIVKRVTSTDTNDVEDAEDAEMP